jgi:predicted dithiol-disulfide oxidoreductase (DUF899 family)
MAMQPKIVSQTDWLAARRELLTKEKEFTRMRDQLTEQRRQMPWVQVEKEYTFETPAGKKSLGDLFAGRSQLMVYHFMFGPEWEEGCPGCSLVADSFNGNAAHIEQRDAAFVAVSRAPLAKIEAFKKRMGWNFKWVSSAGSDFNSDYRVSFSKDEQAGGGEVYNFGTAGFPMEEAPGLSVFAKDAEGKIYRTYGTFGRGLEEVMAVYAYLDRLPKGRDEAGLARPMAWLKHHDKYDAGETRGA